MVLVRASTLFTLLSVLTLLWPVMSSANGAEPVIEWSYALRPNDSLKSISDKMLAPPRDWRALVRHNQIEDLNALKAGDVIRIPITWLKQQPQKANILTSTGYAMIKRAGSGKFAKLKANISIRVGDEIHTKKGSVLVKFADGSLVQITEGSHVIFNRLSLYKNTGMVDVEMRLNKGEVSTQVEPLEKGSRFEVRTPLAVAAVRGTEFRLRTDKSSTTLEVIEGEVSFSNKIASANVRSGQGAIITPQARTIPIKALPSKPVPKFEDVPTDRLPAELQWESSPSAGTYRYHLYDADKREKLVETRELNTPAVTINPLENGTYSLSMRAIDKQGLEGIDQRNSFTVNNNGEPALLNYPEPDAIIEDDRPLFQWQYGRQKVIGKLEIASDLSFENMLSRSAYMSANQSEPEIELSPGTYYWRVLTLNNARQEAFSETRALQIKGKAPISKIIAVNYIDDQVGLFWSKIDGISDYILQVSDDQTFSNILSEQSFDKASAQIRLTSGKTYYARVKGVDTQLIRSDFGPVQELYVQP